MKKNENIERLQKLQKQLEQYQEENRLLKQEQVELKQQQMEEEKLEFPWAGNLGHWEMDLINRKVTANPLKIKALEYDPENDRFSIDDFVQMIHSEDRDRAYQDMKDHLIGKKPVYETEYKIVTRTGKIKWFYDRGVIIKRTPEGSPHTVKGIVFDVTEQKLAEQKIIDSEKALIKTNLIKDQMMRIMAHDLKNSIGNVVNIFELMLQESDFFDPEEEKELKKEVFEASQNSMTLLDNLLHWAHVQQGTMELEKKEIEVFTVLKEIHGMFRTQALQKEIELTIDTEKKEDITAIGDLNMLRTVLRNFTNNALKFTGKGGKISLKARKEQDQIAITVVDNGTGMSEEMIRKIERSESQSNLGTENEKGTGLGLLISKDLIEQTDAKWIIESAMGKGTSMGLRIPGKY